MLQASKIYFHYETCYALLKNICFAVGKGQRIGLIGENGSGKTTLIQLLLGKLKPVSGEIVFSKNIRLGYLPQDFDFTFSGTMFEWILEQFPKSNTLRKEIEDLERQMVEQPEVMDRYGDLVEQYQREGGYDLEQRIESVLSRMGFDRIEMQLPYFALSSGQKRRVAICELFVRRPELLILDEPTNHLDRKGIKLLENYLRQSNFTYILITHDRKLLDNCVEKIFEIENYKLHSYAGNYSQYAREKQQKQEQERARYQQQQQQLNKLKKEFETRKQWSKQKEKTKIGNGACDRGFIGHQAAKMMKRAKNAEKRREHILLKHKVEKPIAKKEIKGIFCQTSRAGNYLAEIACLAKSYGDKNLFEDIHLRVDYGEKIAITGANGCGKTTLLKIIMGDELPDRGEINISRATRIGYCSQNRNLFDFEDTALQTVKKHACQEETLCRIVLAELGIGKKKVERTLAQLSVGERTKVELAVILLSNANLLILDEPTNHLDLQTREALEHALFDYPGAMIFVSHDRYFCEKLATRTLEL